MLNNDPSFKQYTKNHEFYDLNPVAEIEKVKQSVLYVNLKDLEESKEDSKKDEILKSRKLKKRTVQSCEERSFVCGDIFLDQLQQISGNKEAVS